MFIAPFAWFTKEMTAYKTWHRLCTLMAVYKINFENYDFNC